jgi:ribosomal protein S18 acetylase RimI-like enzyme
MNAFFIRAITDADRAWVARFTAEHWGSEQMVMHGEILTISQLPGFVAEQAGEVVGLVTYVIWEEDCEIASLDSLHEGQGIGSALIAAVKSVAQTSRCRRLFLITTNDNIDALRFYQRRGFVLAALRPGAVNQSRKMKPEIPLMGSYGIPIRDEIELEMSLVGG